MQKQDTPLTQKINFSKIKSLLKTEDLAINQEIYTIKERAIERWETDGGSANKNDEQKNKLKSKLYIYANSTIQKIIHFHNISGGM